MNKQCEWIKRYDLPSIKGQGWGRFILTSDGFFSCVTDYGNYSYWWSSVGEQDFRAFVAGLARDAYYVCSKLCQHPYPYNGEATCAAIKHHIIEARKHGHMTAEDAREEFDLLRDNEDVSDVACLTRWYDKTRIEDASELVVHDPPAQTVAFVHKMLPRLAEVLRVEMAAELHPASNAEVRI